MGGTLTGVANTVTMLGGTILVPLVGIVTDMFKDATATYTVSDYRNGMFVLIISVICAIIATLFVEDRPMVR